MSASATGMPNAIILCYSFPHNSGANIMRVSKWGNSLAVRLPKTLVDEMGLRAGGDVTVVRAADRTIPIEKDLRRRQALNRLTDMRIPLPLATNSTATRRTSGDGRIGANVCSAAASSAAA